METLVIWAINRHGLIQRLETEVLLFWIDGVFTCMVSDIVTALLLHGLEQHGVESMIPACQADYYACIVRVLRTRLTCNWYNRNYNREHIE